MELLPGHSLICVNYHRPLKITSTNSHLEEERSKQLQIDSDSQQPVMEILSEEYVVRSNIPKESPISDFFGGKCVLLTGVTGFLGHLYLEKLLRCGARKVFVVMRAKRDSAPIDRLRKMCSGPVFTLLQKIDENFLDRIVIVTGNLDQHNLGISEPELITLKTEVEVVIHAAADVRFNQPIRDLVLCNLFGTRELLSLATQMPGLLVFMYISTAFSQTTHNRKSITEKFYPPPMNADCLIDLVLSRSSDEEIEQLNAITARLIAPWPNNYTFTKALSESMVQRFGSLIPIAVIRPTIVISTYCDPIPAWANSYGGMNGVAAGIGSGLLRNLFWKNVELNIVCADFVTNATLAVAWHTATEYNRTIFEPKVYHINRTSDKTLYFDETIKCIMDWAHTRVPMMSSVWYPTCQKTYSTLHDRLLTIFYQVLPSAAMDLCLPQKKIELVPMHRRIVAMSDVIRFFIHDRFDFDDANMAGVLKRMTEYDRKFFICDSSCINWKSYYLLFAMGTRVHLLRDPVTTFQKSLTRDRYLKYLHFLVKYSMIAVLIAVLFVMFKRVMNSS